MGDHVGKHTLVRPSTR